MVWLFYQRTTGEPEFREEFLVVFKTQSALRKYLKENDWPSRAIQQVCDGDTWYDGDSMYWARAVEFGVPEEVAK